MFKKIFKRPKPRPVTVSRFMAEGGHGRGWRWVYAVGSL